MRPRLLDLFCGAGGAAMGYHRAGFDVVGVDIKPQPHYPFAFIQADALRSPVDLLAFDAIHASPPCQAYTHAKHLGHRGRQDHPRLIAPTRAMLRAVDRPYVIENVEDALPELNHPIRLCGSSLDLVDLERHRLFETNWPVMAVPCTHGQHGPARFPSTPRSDGSKPPSRIVNPMASGTSHAMLAIAMGVDWIPPTGRRPTQGLRDAIPPAYTEFIGQQLIEQLEHVA